VEITYDPAKNERNIAERGLSFELAREVDFTTAVIWEDVRKVYPERRFLALAPIQGRICVTVFCPEGSDIRVISLRKANKREITRYETATN
jgi:uncharacterized DUF497 family protein